MPLYFFDIADHHTQIDDEGTELTGDAEARVEAIVYAGSLLRDDPSILGSDQGLRVDVYSETRDPILSVHVSARDRSSDEAAID
jgi:hypothetical protein